MKKLYFILVLLILVSFMGCSNVSSYSCDPEIDAKVKSNLKEISLMDRSDWVMLKEDFKKPVYRAFTPDQRLNFWKGKHEELKKMNWSDAELAHINSIYSLIYEKPDIFNKDRVRINEERDELDIFIYNWIEYAREELKWNKKLIYSICFSGEKLSNARGEFEINANDNIAVIVPTVKSRSESGSGNDCACSSISDYCDIFGEARTFCNTTIRNCSHTIDGCGIFLQYSCDGVCVGYGITKSI